MTIFKQFLIKFLAVIVALQGVAAVSLLQPFTAQAAGGPAVVINEVQWMGSQTDVSVRSDDQWIELYNTTNADIALDDWSIPAAGVGADDLDGRIIKAGGYAIISRYANGGGVSRLMLPIGDPMKLNIPVATLAMTTDCPAGGLLLLDDLTATVDQAGCDISAWPAGETTAVTKKAMERLDPNADGSLPASWVTSKGFVNLVDRAAGYTFGTPGVWNDQTFASPGSVIDVRDFTQTADVDFTASTTELRGRWTPFTDPESGIWFYQVSVQATVLSATGSGWQYVLPGTLEAQVSGAFVPGVTYYFAVRAYNRAGLVSKPAFSDGITVNVADPAAPTNVQAIDTPSDNGGSVLVSWDASLSTDEITYQVAHKKTTDPLFSAPADAGSALSLTVTGLENDLLYDFAVYATDFNGQQSPVPAQGQGMARDNMAPILDAAKVIVGQNKPGSNDTVSGAAGAVSEPVTITVFDKDPTDPMAAVIGATASNTDGSFASISLGDNALGLGWLELVDGSGNTSVAQQFTNDIVAPNAPTLAKLESDCKTETCRVELRWLDNGPDTASYQIGYTVNGVEHRTLTVPVTTIILDLPSNETYSFVVYAFDAAGNQSAKSNAFVLPLTSGVAATVTYENGAQVIVVRAVPGSRAVIATSAAEPKLTPAIIAPARAAEPTTPAQVAEQQTSVPSGNNSQDWLRIFVVVLLLLIVAGGFYALSRSFNESEEALLADAPPARKRGRPKKNPTDSPKPKRPRGRPRKG